MTNPDETTADRPKPAPETRHGLAALRKKVQIRGLAAIDWRSAGARDLAAWRAELFRDLGGEENVSAQKRALCEQALRTRLFLDCADAYLLSLPTVIVGRKKTLHPLVAQRQQLADSLTRTLERLGLDRVPPPISAETSGQLARAKAEIQKLMKETEEEPNDEHERGSEHEGGGTARVLQDVRAAGGDADGRAADGGDREDD